MQLLLIDQFLQLKLFSIQLNPRKYSNAIVSKHGSTPHDSILGRYFHFWYQCFQSWTIYPIIGNSDHSFPHWTGEIQVHKPLPSNASDLFCSLSSNLVIEVWYQGKIAPWMISKWFTSWHHLPILNQLQNSQSLHQILAHLQQFEFAAHVVSSSVAEWWVLLGSEISRRIKYLGNFILAGKLLLNKFEDYLHCNNLRHILLNYQWVLPFNEFYQIVRVR